MLPNAINGSADLAVILNAQPATAEDANETPRDWIAGIQIFGGDVYPLDPDATTDTLAVLADGTAAAVLSPAGTWCTGGGHDRRAFGYGDREHWCPADVDSWTEQGDVRGVRRDWRSVYVWDANGFAETDVYDTVDAAKEAFDREVAEMKKHSPQG